MKKWLLCSILILSVVGPAFTAGRKDETARRTYTLKIGMVVTDKDPMFTGAMAMKREVEERTRGGLTIEVFPSAQLGDTQDLQEMAKAGANVAPLTDAARLAEMVPELGIIQAPFLLRSYDEAVKLTTSSLWRGWEDRLAAQHNLRILSFNWYQGARHLLTHRPINTPADLAGIRMRTPGSPIWQETVRAMGAVPTALAWAEVYNALQQRVIDGLEAQHPAVHGARLYEVIKHITKTAHFQLITGLVVGEGWFRELPSDYQRILVEAAFNGGRVASEATLALLDDFENRMRQEGVTIRTIDVTPFVNATQVVYERLNLMTLRRQVEQVLGR